MNNQLKLICLVFLITHSLMSVNTACPVKYSNILYNLFIIKATTAFPATTVGCGYYNNFNLNLNNISVNAAYDTPSQTIRVLFSFHLKI